MGPTPALQEAYIVSVRMLFTAYNQQPNIWLTELKNKAGQIAALPHQERPGLACGNDMPVALVPGCCPYQGILHKLALAKGPFAR